MAEDYNLDYDIIGSGEKTIVFVHYFGGDSGSWRWMAKRLRKKHTCILLNLPGFGNTPPLSEPSIYNFAQYINACIDELKLEDYILCGHSMGAKLVLYAAKLKLENRPTSLVLIAPSPPTVENMDKEERERMLNHPDEQEATITVNSACQKKLLKKRFAYAVQSQLNIHEATWDWWLKKGMRHSIADRIQGLEIPSHVIYSNNDPVIEPEAIHKEVLPYLESPSVIALGKVGHLIPLETPRKLARQIKRISKVRA